MKPVIIIAIAFVLLIPIPVFAQVCNVPDISENGKFDVTKGGNYSNNFI